MFRAMGSEFDSSFYSLRSEMFIDRDRNEILAPFEGAGDTR